MFNPETLALEIPDDPDGDANIEWAKVVWLSLGICAVFAAFVAMGILIWLAVSVFGL